MPREWSGIMTSVPFTKAGTVCAILTEIIKGALKPCYVAFSELLHGCHLETMLEKKAIHLQS